MRSAIAGLLIIAAAVILATIAAAQEKVLPSDSYDLLTPAESYKKGCGGCHTNERAVLRKIPRKTEDERRQWIEAFIAQHPCECDPVKPKIVEYLLEKTRR